MRKEFNLVGHNLPFIDAIEWLIEENRKMIFEENAKKVYPRLTTYVK